MIVKRIRDKQRMSIKVLGQDTALRCSSYNTDGTFVDLRFFTEKDEYMLLELHRAEAAKLIAELTDFINDTADEHRKFLKKVGVGGKPVLTEA